MKTLVRFSCMVGLLGLVVMPLSAVPRDPGERGLRLRSRVGHAHFTETGLTKTIGCSIDCGNGDTAYKNVETRGGCLDACESFCGTTCTLN
jgi:hypothetical protein